MTSAHAVDPAPVAAVPALTTLLRPQRVEVEILRVALPADLQAIDDRVSAAVRDRPEWYVNLNDATPAGDPIPYDRRFGVTQAEFSRLIAGKAQVTITGHSTLTIGNGSRSGDLTLRGGAGLEDLAGVNLLRVPNGKYHVSTRIGTAGSQQPFVFTAESPLGTRSGYSWSLGSPKNDRLNVQYALLRIGLLQDGGQLVIQYRMYEDQDGARLRNVDLTVRTVGYKL